MHDLTGTVREWRHCKCDTMSSPTRSFFFLFLLTFPTASNAVECRTLIAYDVLRACVLMAFTFHYTTPHIMLMHIA